jgi:hypothetical protein
MVLRMGSASFKQIAGGLDEHPAAVGRTDATPRQGEPGRTPIFAGSFTADIQSDRSLSRCHRELLRSDPFWGQTTPRWNDEPTKAGA